jgi:exodeoxyribonuclease V beta subunit
MRRFDVLECGLDILGHHFLEASAGTGKTFAIEHLVARLILEAKAAFSIDQILVVTFTKAATRELKKRIRLNLQQAFEALQKKEGEGYLAQFFETGTREAESRLEAALICFDAAQIFTIHGFCHRMLSEFGFLVDEPEERAYKEVLRDHVRDFFRTHFEKETFSQSQLELLLKRHQHDGERIIEALLPLVENSGSIRDPAGFQELYQHFQEGLKGLEATAAKKLLEDFHALSPFYKGMQQPVDEVAKIAEIVEKKQCCPEEFERLLLEEVPFLEGWREDNIKIRPKMPASLTLHYPGFFHKMTTALSPSLQKARNPSRILLSLAEACKKKWEGQLLFREKLAPDEILSRMHRHLDDPQFFKAVTAKYRAVIIDEFQDTDPLQWEIFHRLFLTEQTAVKACYLIGDPKQAIYGFRSADIYTYLEALHFLGEDKKSFLDTNFRSVPELIEALNAFFSLSAWMELPLWKQAMPYSPVKAGLPAAPEKGGLHFFVMEAKSGREKNWPTPAHEELYFFPFIAREIQSFSPSARTAILVKDRFQADRVHSYLKRFNIASSVKRGQSIQSNPYLNDLKDLLEAVDDPKETLKVKTALATTLLGWSCDEILAGEKIYPEPFNAMNVEAMRSFFHELRRLLEERGACLFFQKLFELIAPSAELRQLCEFLLEKAPSDLLFFVKEVKNKEGEEFFDANFEGEAEAVVIMTTHTSKGLEFDNVFALGIAFRHGKQEETVRLRTQILSFDAQDPLWYRGVQETEAEKLRQLYVALTRAKKRVYVPLPIDVERKEETPLSPLELFLEKALGVNPEKSALYALLDRLAKTAHVTYALIDPDQLPKKQELAEQKPQKTKLVIPAFPEESYSSFTGLSKKRFPLTSPVSLENALPLGKDTGILIHHLLEEIFARGWNSPYQEEKIKEMVSQKLSKTAFEIYKDQILLQIQTALHQKLPTTDFALVDVPSSHLLEEMEFLFPEKELLIKGFIDLVFHKANKYYLLDWKSNTLESYDQEHLKAAMVHHDYLLQASLYATALKRYVKLFDSAYEFGGAFYYFLRGHAVYHFFPDP